MKRHHKCLIAFGLVATFAMITVPMVFYHFYANVLGPFPAIERVDLPADMTAQSYDAGRTGSYCEVRGPGSIKVLAHNNSLVLWEYQRTDDDFHYRECERGRHFSPLPEWNRLAREAWSEAEQYNHERRRAEQEQRRQRAERQRLENMRRELERQADQNPR